MLVVIVGIQFIPSRTNNNRETSPSDFITVNRVPENIGNILHTSCYDCHSNSTNYPWYSRIQPIGYFLQNHIDKGKAELNFSEFGTYSERRQKSKLRSMASQIEKDEMPLKSYLIIHHEARLSLGNKRVFLDYLTSLQDSLPYINS